MGRLGVIPLNCTELDGKDQWNTDEYTTAFLHSDWLYFQWHQINSHIQLHCALLLYLGKVSLTHKGLELNSSYLQSMYLLQSHAVFYLYVHCIYHII